MNLSIIGTKTFRSHLGMDPFIIGLNTLTHPFGMNLSTYGFNNFSLSLWDAPSHYWT